MKIPLSRLVGIFLAAMLACVPTSLLAEDLINDPFDSISPSYVPYGSLTGPEAHNFFGSGQNVMRMQLEVDGNFSGVNRSLGSLNIAPGPWNASVDWFPLSANYGTPNDFRFLLEFESGLAVGFVFHSDGSDYTMSAIDVPTTSLQPMLLQPDFPQGSGWRNFSMVQDDTKVSYSFAGSLIGSTLHDPNDRLVNMVLDGRPFQYQSTLYLDNLSLQAQAVPEPGTLAMLGLAGLSLLFFRRRRK